MTTLLELRGVAKDYPVRGGHVRALDGVDLDVSPGDFVCVVGASGSGKSTLLSLIAGLSGPSAGRITLDGVPVTGPGPDRGLVFQSGALYPWRTVERNVAFGLELLPIDAAERARRVDWYLAETGLTAVRQSLPKQLSGGQQQRVAIARALACEPEVLLLDEPFGALDVQTKEDMQVLIRQVWQDTGTTVLMVTHDVEEAVFLGRRVVVLASDPGRVAADVEVSLPDDRDLAVKRAPEFLALRASIEDLVREQHRGRVARGVGG
ncbi:ABC transporter ATP-binding protein [Amycolatopsis sp. NPDC059021]|uniref:ABC transporter ATP-binding protein n=1 Tax=Amycolatopsis sp. NPDC059021 TaxID=3346704 RepID=UPI00366B813A